jgi:hypothetical protein
VQRNSLIAFALLSALGLLTGCRKSAPLAFRVSLPPEAKDTAKFIEIGAFQNLTCATVGRSIAGGIPEGASARVAWATSGVSGALGDLPSGNYAFAALAKSGTCTVVAAGCTEIALKDSTNVAVRTEAVTGGAGTCETDARCTVGRCVPTATAGECSMVLLGAGPLAPKLGSTLDAHVQVASPAITAKEDGFLVGYTEFVANAESDAIVWASALPIGFNGAPGPADHQILEQRCRSSPQVDSVGLALSPASEAVSLFALARNPCATGAATGGVDARALQRDGTGIEAGYSILGNSLDSVALSHAKSTTNANATTKPNDFFVTSTLKSDALLFRVNYVGKTLKFGAPPTILFPGAYGGAWVASSDAALALLLLGKGPAPSSLAVHAWPLAQVPSVTPYTAVPQQTIKDTVWASPAFASSRLWIATGDARGTRLRSFRLNASALQPGPVTDVNPLQVSPLGDLAVLRYEKTSELPEQQRAIVATGELGDVNLKVFDLKDDKATLLRAISLASLGISGQKGARDAQVSVAAAGNRVAVVWVTAHDLEPDDPLGSYAVFSCER